MVSLVPYLILKFIIITNGQDIYSHNFQSNYNLNKIPGSILSDGGTVSYAGSPYIVEGDIVIAESITVYIEPGVEIRFAPGTGIDVYGTLLARGLSDKRILFASTDIPHHTELYSSSNDRKVRLTDGSSVSNGRLQIFYNNKWLNVCTQPFNWTFVNNNPIYKSQRYWTQNDVAVACKSFGYDNGTFENWSPLKKDLNNVLLHSPSCTGNENQLSSCKSWFRGKVGKGICGETSENYAIGLKCWNDKKIGDYRAKSPQWRGITFYNASYSSVIISNLITSNPNTNGEINSLYHTDYDISAMNFIKPTNIGSKNWQHNKSQSILEYLDIIYAGIDRQGSPTAAILAYEYPPFIKGVNVSHNAFTAIEYLKIKGSPIILSSTISFNDGDGIRIHSNHLGNVSIEYSSISNNAGKGIRFISDPIKAKDNYDFCIRPNLGLNQVYPIQISGNEHSECIQIFETVAGHITIHFLDISYNNNSSNYTDVTQSPYLEIRDGSNMYDKLITRIYFRPLLRPQAITSSGTKIWIKFVSKGVDSYKQNKHSLTFNLLILNKNGHDIAISNSIITCNGLQGIHTSGLTNFLKVTSSNISFNGYEAGLYVQKGASNIELYDTDFKENIGAGLIIDNAGGTINITTCRIQKNEGMGLKLHTSSSDINYNYLSINNIQKSIIYNTTFVDNKGVSIFLEKDKNTYNVFDEYHINISHSSFTLNKFYSIYIGPTLKFYNSSTKVLITNNSFDHNSKPAIKIDRWSCLNAMIGSNKFTNHSKGVLVLGSVSKNINIEKSKSGYDAPDLDISYNHFYKNIGNFVLLANYEGQAGKITIRYNHFKNNIIKNLFNNIPPRSQVNAVVIVNSASVIITRNHFINPFSDYEIGTRSIDRSLTIKAPYNWFNCKSSIDQLQIEEIAPKIFDNRLRYNLARILYQPFLKNSNLNGPASTVEWSKKFVRGNVIGGYLEDYLVLKEENSPYVVKEDIYITKSGKLHIESNVEVMFENMIGVFVEGEIFADGGNGISRSIIFFKKPDSLQTSLLKNNDSLYYDNKQIDLSIEENAKHSSPASLSQSSNNSNISHPIGNWEDLLKHEQQLYLRTRSEDLKMPQLVRLIQRKTLENRASIRLGADKRLHVKINGIWGTVCNKGWTIENAKLVCRSLGKILDNESWNLDAPNPLPNSYSKKPYPEAILMNMVDCDESDNDIKECFHESQHEHSCTHESDVALSCVDPEWAGVRLGFFSRRSHLKGLTVQGAGTFDPDTGETISALTFDLNIHHVENVVIQKNKHDGLIATYHNLFETSTMDRCSIAFNGGHGILVRSPGLTTYSCNFEENLLNGIKYDPYMSLSNNFDIFKWDGLTTFPEKAIIKMNVINEAITDSANYILDNNQEIYLYFKYDQKSQYQAIQEKLSFIDFKTQFKISTIDTNVLALQLFGPYPFYSSLNLTIIDQHETYYRLFELREQAYNLPIVSLTHRLLINFKHLCNHHEEPFYNFIVSIKSIIRTLNFNVIPTIKMQNATFARNNEGASITTYDSDDNTNILIPFTDINLIPIYDMHLRQKSLVINFFGSKFIDNKVAISMNSPFYNKKILDANNLTLTCESCSLIGNFKLFRTNDLYNYDSNSIWNIFFLKSVFYNNYGGILISWPYFIENNGVYRASWQTHFHRLSFFNNTFSNNRNFTLVVQGSYAKIDINNNIFANNLVSLTTKESPNGLSHYAMIELLDSCKALRINNNSFDNNIANVIIRIELYSNDGPLSSTRTHDSTHMGILKYNYFRYNKPNNFVVNNQITNLPQNYLVGLYGIQPMTFSYNLFQSNAFEYYVIAGLEDQLNYITSQQLNYSQTHIFRRYEKGNDYLDARFNYWDSSEIKEIRKRIYDFNQCNMFVKANWYPYLTIANLDNSPVSQGNFYSGQFDPDYQALGGHILTNTLLTSHKSNGGVYYVQHDITVAPGVKFTISEGVILEFAPNIGILVYGTLDIQGSLENPVIFKLAKKELGQNQNNDNAQLNKNYKSINSLNFDKVRAEEYPHFASILPTFVEPNNFHTKNIHSKYPFVIRLNGIQRNTNEGFLEYFNNTLQQWYPYCDRFFNALNAKIICQTLGFEFNDAYYFEGWRQDIDSFWVNRIKYWAHPLDCYGYEQTWNHCYPRFIESEPSTHTKCYGSHKHLFIKCKVKSIGSAQNNLFWGNIRFLDHHSTETILDENLDHDLVKPKNQELFAFQDQKQNPRQVSTLRHLEIMNAGMLHNTKASAILISGNANVKIDSVKIKNCAWHGVSYFNPKADIRLISPSDSINIIGNRGFGINIINLGNSKFGKQFNKKVKNWNSFQSLYLDAHLFGSNAILDICGSRVPIEVSPWMRKPLLIGHVRKRNQIQRCYLYFTTSPQTKLGFTLMQSSFTNSYRKSSLKVFDNYPFSSVSMIAELNATNPGIMVMFKSQLNKLGIIMEINPGDVDQWIGQIITIPSTLYFKPTSHEIQSLNIERNELGALNYVSLGEFTPTIHISKNNFLYNGIHALNFSLPQPIVSINVQNAESVKLTNNYFYGNKGNTFKIQSQFDSDVKFLNTIISNNVFANNMYGTIMNIVGTSPFNINQFVYFSECIIRNNYSPLSELIKVSQALLNMSHNLVQNNTARNHILYTYGFNRIIPHSPQIIGKNYLLDNTVIYQKQFKNQDLVSNLTAFYFQNIDYETIVSSTIFAGNAFQNYLNNYIYNPKNMYELATNIANNDIWGGPVMAQNNWWGSNHHAAISGRIKDREDDVNLKPAITRPFLSSNSSILEGECPPGWYHEDNNFCYVYVGGVMKYIDAYKFCNDLGGTIPYIIADQSVLIIFRNKHQYSPQSKNSIWIQKQPSSYLKNYDKCYAQVDEAIEDYSCSRKLPFVCEIMPLSKLSIMGWMGNSVNLYIILIIILVISLVSSALMCWKCKSKQRKKEAFVRSNSMRSSIRSTRSLNSNGTVGINNKKISTYGNRNLYKNKQPNKINSYDLYSLTTLTTISEAGFRENAPSVLNDNNFMQDDNDIISETGTNLSPNETSYANYGQMNNNHTIPYSFNRHINENFYENISKAKLIQPCTDPYDSCSGQSGTILIQSPVLNHIGRNKTKNVDANIIENTKKSYADIIYRPEKLILKPKSLKDKDISKTEDEGNEMKTNNFPLLPLLTSGINDSAYDSNGSKDNFFRDKTSSDISYHSQRQVPCDNTTAIENNTLSKNSNNNKPNVPFQNIRFSTINKNKKYIYEDQNQYSVADSTHTLHQLKDSDPVNHSEKEEEQDETFLNLHPNKHYDNNTNSYSHTFCNTNRSKNQLNSLLDDEPEERLCTKHIKTNTSDLGSNKVIESDV